MGLFFHILQENLSLLLNVEIDQNQLSFYFDVVCLLVLNATFNNISVILWQSVLLVEESGGLENTTDLSQVTDKLFTFVLATCWILDFVFLELSISIEIPMFSLLLVKCILEPKFLFINVLCPLVRFCFRYWSYNHIFHFTGKLFLWYAGPHYPLRQYRLQPRARQAWGPKKVYFKLCKDGCRRVRELLCLRGHNFIRLGAPNGHNLARLKRYIKSYIICI